MCVSFLEGLEFFCSFPVPATNPRLKISLDDTKQLVLKLMIVAVTRSNCDEIYEAGIQEDGVYDIFSKISFDQVYCEFDRNGSNWLVSAENYHN